MTPLEIPILLVDDQKDNLLALSAVLDKPEYTLTLAHSGEEALERLLDNPDYACIIMDIKMPGMSGFEAVKYIRSRKSTQDVPVIFLTGHNWEDVSYHKGYMLQAIDYISKPVQPYVIATKVDVLARLYSNRIALEETNQLLAKKSRELAHARDHLEEEVAARTAALFESERNLRQIIDLVPHMIFARNREGRFVLANRATAENYGLTVEEITGKLLQDIHKNQDEAAKFLEQDELVFESQQSISLNAQPFTTNEGDSRTLRTVKNPFRRMGMDQQVLLGVSVDITRQTELDAMRDNFIATVSHELRTPLASIMGWTETLLSEQPGPLTEKQQRFLSINYKSSKRLNMLIEEILTVSNIQPGQLRIARDPVGPDIILGTVIGKINDVAAASEITLNVFNDWPSRDSVKGDQERLEQVLNNILDNAIKFSHKGDAVTIRSKRVEGNWYVEVTDTGMGIPESELPLLFQRFFRATNAKEAHIQGTGLGLYICQAIVESHGVK